MDDLLTTLEHFLRDFSPTYIYEGAYQIALAYLTTLSGVLLIIAVIIRLSNSSLDSLDGNGRYAALIKSLLVWGTVLALYFVLAGLIIEFFNVLYSWTRTNGSIGRALSELGQVLQHIEERQAAAREDMNALALLGDLAGNIPRGIAFVLFFVSFVLLVSVQLVFQIAQAMGYTAALVFGTVAIPMAVSQKLSVLKGWGVFTATVLIWPIIESLFMYLLIGMTSQMQIDVGGAGASNASAAGIYLVFTVMNSVMAVTIVAAPFVTQALVSNSGSIAGLVTPFVGGAMATTAAVTKSMLDRTLTRPARAAGAGIGQAASASGGAALQAARQALGGSPGPTPVRTTPSPARSPADRNPADRNPAGGNSTAPDSVRPTVMTAASALEAAQAGSPVEAPGALPDAATTGNSAQPRRDASQQARRGAMINQHKKAK
jgi:hypothetical protein